MSLTELAGLARRLSSEFAEFGAPAVPDHVEDAGDPLVPGDEWLTEYDRRITDEELRDYFVNAELLAMERCFLETSSLVLGRIAGGRGSYLAGAIGDFLEIDAKGRASALRGPKIGAMALDETVEVELSPDGRPVARVVGVRPVPEEDAWFERVWREHRDGSVYGTA